MRHIDVLTALQLADHLVQIANNLAQLAQLIFERWPTWQTLLQ